MKKLNFTLFKKSAAILCIATLIFMGSCKDDDHPEQEVTTISAIVSTNKDFSLLKSALIQADLVDVLAGNGPFLYLRLTMLLLWLQAWIPKPKLKHYQ